jgi:hypothetical protein
VADAFVVASVEGVGRLGKADVLIKVTPPAEYEMRTVVYIRHSSAHGCFVVEGEAYQSIASEIEAQAVDFLIKEVEPVADFFFELFGVLFGAFGLVKDKVGFVLAFDAEGAPVGQKMEFFAGYLEDVVCVRGGVRCSQPSRSCGGL